MRPNNITHSRAHTLARTHSLLRKSNSSQTMGLVGCSHFTRHNECRRENASPTSNTDNHSARTRTHTFVKETMRKVPRDSAEIENCENNGKALKRRLDTRRSFAYISAICCASVCHGLQLSSRFVACAQNVIVNHISCVIREIVNGGTHTSCTTHSSISFLESRRWERFGGNRNSFEMCRKMSMRKKCTTKHS